MVGVVVEVGLEVAPVLGTSSMCGTTLICTALGLLWAAAPVGTMPSGHRVNGFGIDEGRNRKIQPVAPADHTQDMCASCVEGLLQFLEMKSRNEV